MTARHRLAATARPARSVRPPRRSSRHRRCRRCRTASGVRDGRSWSACPRRDPGASRGGRRRRPVGSRRPRGARAGLAAARPRPRDGRPRAADGRGDHQAADAHALHACGRKNADRLAARARPGRGRSTKPPPTIGLVARSAVPTISARCARLRDPPRAAARWTEALSAQERSWRRRRSTDAGRANPAGRDPLRARAAAAWPDAAAAQSRIPRALRVPTGSSCRRRSRSATPTRRPAITGRRSAPGSAPLESSPAASRSCRPARAALSAGGPTEPDDRPLRAATGRAPDDLALAVGAGAGVLRAGDARRGGGAVREGRGARARLAAVHAFLGTVFERRGRVARGLRGVPARLGLGRRVRLAVSVRRVRRAARGWAGPLPSCRRWNTLRPVGSEPSAPCARGSRARRASTWCSPRSVPVCGDARSRAAAIRCAERAGSGSAASARPWCRRCGAALPRTEAAAALQRRLTLRRVPPATPRYDYARSAARLRRPASATRSTP